MNRVSDGRCLYVGIMYKIDFSDANYFLYVNRDGLSIGWHLLQSGELTEEDGLIEFDCGKYGKGYVSLNKDNYIQKIEYGEGWEPSIRENINRPIIERSDEVIYFYDANGNVVEPDKYVVLH